MVVRVRAEPSFAFTSPVGSASSIRVCRARNPRPFDTLLDGRILGVARQA